MKTLAFLQNMWVRDPERVKRGVARYGEEYRRRLMAWALFAGCLTGRRLKAAFGPAAIEAITWEESSKEIGGVSSAAFPADKMHILTRIREEKPDVVLAFGRPANDGVAAALELTANLTGTRPNVIVLTAPHPAARGTGTVLALAEVAAKWRQVVG